MSEFDSDYTVLTERSCNGAWYGLVWAYKAFPDGQGYH
jgi:hypothetical protein